MKGSISCKKDPDWNFFPVFLTEIRLTFQYRHWTRDQAGAGNSKLFQNKNFIFKADLDTAQYMTDIDIAGQIYVSDTTKCKHFPSLPFPSFPSPSLQVSFIFLRCTRS